MNDDDTSQRQVQNNTQNQGYDNKLKLYHQLKAEIEGEPTSTAEQLKDAGLDKGALDIQLAEFLGDGFDLVKDKVTGKNQENQSVAISSQTKETQYVRRPVTDYPAIETTPKNQSNHLWEMMNQDHQHHSEPKQQENTNDLEL